MSIINEKLTDQQLRIVQLVAGILSGAALIVALFVAGRGAEDNVFLTYLWLVVFVVIMFGRRWIERKYRLRLFFYNLVLVNTLCVGILIYLCVIFFSPTSMSEFSEEYTTGLRVLTVVAPALAVLILGVILPLKRYKKRTENGTLRPTRLPEPKEEDESEDTPANSGPMSIDQQIAAMTKELDSDKEDKDEQ